ncbi:hypothetical protein ACIQFZ_36635 [Streptomyces sp. NPDC093064]|uniref:hypothetical protein n=1 Tax=Streptomyces sp. NPDC093064 TaxID=3366020 RepID=UPI00380D1CA0
MPAGWTSPGIQHHRWLPLSGHAPEEQKEIQNLRERIREARGNGWLGVVEGLQVSLDAAIAKLVFTDPAPPPPREPGKHGARA